MSLEEPRFSPGGASSPGRGSFYQTNTAWANQNPLDPAAGYRGQQGLLGPGSATSPNRVPGAASHYYASRTALPNPALTQNQLPNMYGAILGQQEGLYQPEIEALMGSADWKYKSIGGIAAGYDTQRAAMQGSLGADKALLANQAQGTQILLQALGLEAPFINKMRGLDLSELNRQSDRELRGNRRDYTRRGAIFTPGYGEDVFDIQSGRWIGTQKINTQADKSLADVDTRRKQLENEARSYGIKADQLEAALKQGLAQLGLDQVLNVQNVIQGVQSDNQQIATLNRQVIEQSLGIWNQAVQTGVMPILNPTGAGAGAGGTYTSGRRGAQ